MRWRWVSKRAAVAIHNEQIAEHGGEKGLRDEGLLEAAMARPRNLSAYSDVGVTELAAAYAVGLIKNHPFVDGNKRTAFVVSATFLLLNGFDIIASEKVVVETFSSLAAGEISEEELGSWYKEFTVQNEGGIGC